MAFFSKQQTGADKYGGSKRLQGCSSCGLYKQVQTPRLKLQGLYERKIMLISEAPTRQEDRSGEFWVGRQGQFLKNSLRHIGIDVEKDCITIDAVCCHTTDVKPIHIEACRRNVFNAIQKYQPRIIILFGMTAVKSVIGSRWQKSIGSIQKWVGWTIPDMELKCWICPTYDINYVMNSKFPEVQVLWEKTLKNIENVLWKTFPKYETPDITYVEEAELYRLPEWIEPGMQPIAIDYETTGIKPDRKGHRIICAAIAVSTNKAYVFEIPGKKRARQPFLEILQNKRIPKIAHNMKFEHKWTKIRLGCEVQGWLWDTMLAAHVLDNRPDTKSLKFQTYVNLGIVDYDSDVAPYLGALQAEQNEFGANAINKIQECITSPTRKKALMRYCALDTIYTYRLMLVQQYQFDLPF